MNLHRGLVLLFCVSSIPLLAFFSFLSLPFFVGLFHFYFLMPSCLLLFSVVSLFLFLFISVSPPFYLIVSFPYFVFFFVRCCSFRPACLSVSQSLSLYAALIVAGCRAGGAPA
jgi:hypothetical protein